MLDDVVVEKGETINRAVNRAREEYRAASDFDTDYTHQDAAVLNLQRACEAVIDIGNHLLLVKRLGPASETRQIFEKLERAGLIDKTLREKLAAMAAFRNVVVHAYRDLDLDIVRRVVLHDADDLIVFANIALKITASDQSG